jgi:hypothetical protein
MPKKIDAAGFGLPSKPQKQKPQNDQKPAPTEQGRKRRVKSEGEAFERLTVYLPQEMARKLGHYCVDTRCSASDAITRALEKLVG